MSLIEKMVNIQSKLHAPKGQINDFGNFKYRSCEDIVEAVKPLLAEEGLILLIYDEIVLIGDRYYVKAHAEITDGETSISAAAYAREPQGKKAMDEAQVTGATSSYARKYALNGLLAIDDTKDADTKDNRKLGQMNGEKLEMDKIQRAAAYIRGQIDGDDPDLAPKKIKAAWERLSNDERIEVTNLLGDKATGTNRMYKTLLMDYIKAAEEDNG